MSRVFISYSHYDQRYVNDIKSVRLNNNHSLSFRDSSLPEPIYNGDGHVNRRPPYDFASMPVREKISELLRDSDKLLVLVGDDTHSKLWVEWEIEEFRSQKWNPDILVMKIPGSLAGAPTVAQRYEIYEWDLDFVSKWVRG